ncbi:hypothetical protein K443DRAFT_681238 [Laccaria amethystina LaAM-08-1]|uniref:Uncharacterized protein n=1 Tax=Laccaria amethystina LaAM-08-1 TaxID=1095629 RepID=A0A0C9WYF7_9AGAR|nr:hypothetical protein K443DRAFT_681238 [Laccaria amethystina LaAM-08-1]
MKKEKGGDTMKQFLDGFDKAATRRLAKELKLLTKMTKVRVRKEIMTLPEDEARKLLTKLLTDLQKVEKPFRREMIRFRLRVDEEERRTQTRPTKRRKVSPLEWAGAYDVYAPKLSEEHQEARKVLSLETGPSSTASQSWASFDFGVVQGILRSFSPPPKALGEKVYFLWRGNIKGEMKFGDDNIGVVTFLGDGKIQGSMDGAGFSKFNFFGRLKTRMTGIGEKAHLSKVTGWKRQWRGINASLRDAEMRQRYGQYSRGESERPDSPAVSDTTAASDEGGSEDDENEESSDGEGSDDGGR